MYNRLCLFGIMYQLVSVDITQDGPGKQQKSKQVLPDAKNPGDDVSVDMLDIRVGQIVKVQQHPNADSLYVEDIDLGEDKPRQVGPTTELC